MSTQLSVFFKLMQKDDKKEVLKFEIPGNDDDAAGRDLFDMSGGIVVFNIEGCDAGDVTAEFKNIQRDDKKTVIKFFIKGDSEEKAQQLYKHAGRNVTLNVSPSQMSIEEFYKEPHQGVQYQVDGNGNVNVDHNQVSMDDVEGGSDKNKELEELPL